MLYGGLIGMKEIFEEPQTFSEAVYDDIGEYYLQYIVIGSKDFTVGNENLCNVYSLLVIKMGESAEAERFFAYDIARSYDRAYEILSVLKCNTVTPCAVSEILDEIL